MHMHRCGARAHKAGGVWLIAVLGFTLAAGPASAQAPASPVAAPSEAVQRQANSPYRFILQNANAPTRKPAPAPAPAPAAVEKKPKPVEQASVTRPAAVQVAPAPAQVAPEPAPTPEAFVAPALPEPAQPHLEVVPVRTDDPKLPATLLRERPSGVVRVQFDLNPDGSTGNVKVVSSTNRALNRVSIDAVSNWKFQPVDEVLSIETELAYKYD